MSEAQGNKVVSGDGRFVQFIQDPNGARAPSGVSGLVSPPTHSGSIVDGGDGDDGRAARHDRDEPIYAHAGVTGLISPTTHTGTNTEHDQHLGKLAKTGSYTDALATGRPLSQLSPLRPPISVTHFESPYAHNDPISHRVSVGSDASALHARPAAPAHILSTHSPAQSTRADLSRMAQSPGVPARQLPATPPNHQLAHTHTFGADPTAHQGSERDEYIKIVGAAGGEDGAHAVSPPHQHGRLLSGERFAEPPKHWKQFEDTQAGYNLDKHARKRRSVQGGLLGAITNPTGYAAAVTLLFAFAITLFIVGVAFSASQDSDDADSHGDLGLYLGLPFMVFGAAFFIATSMSVRSHFMSEESTCFGGRMHSHKDFETPTFAKETEQQQQQKWGTN